MLILKKLNQLNAAAMRASKQDSRLRVVDFGIYDVIGKSNKWRRVTCKKLDDGTRLVFCSCEDEFPRRPNSACWHMPIAVGAHIILVLARRSVILTYEGESYGAPERN